VSDGGMAVDMGVWHKESKAMRWVSGGLVHASSLRRAGGEQGGRVGSDRFGVRGVTGELEVLIDRGVADRGFAASEPASR